MKMSEKSFHNGLERNYLQHTIQTQEEAFISITQIANRLAALRALSFKLVES